MKNGQLVYDPRYNVVGKVIDAENQEIQLIDELGDPDATIYVFSLEQCSLATDKQILEVFRRKITQAEMMDSASQEMEA